jgi:uncharacterized damage-inducible protein DinB
MNRKTALMCAVVLLCGAGLVRAQAAESPLVGATKGFGDWIKGNLMKAAEQMPEADYAFKPTPEVRSFGQVLGHAADANYMMCSAVRGEKAPVADVEKTKTTKTDLVKALGDSFAYCDKAYADMTEAKALELMTFFGRQQPRVAVLAFNNSHNYEHYGNIVVYLRLKGLVPPSSQRAPK